jgi:hypothetical protein
MLASLTSRYSLVPYLNKLLPHHDYVSAGLETLPASVESHFPEMEYASCFNPYLRHRGRRDRRFPSVGWATWDEATLLYNYGLKLRGREFLEIGCWVGWSTVVLALAGVRLTSVDPVLAGAPQGEACRASLANAGLTSVVELSGEPSPAGVDALASRGRRWTGFFIDGDHEGDAPMRDAQQCARLAEPDSVILLHDAVQENIASTLYWLRDAGWKVGVHYTSQFIAVAYRGNFTPLAHTPDPRVDWESLIRKRFPHLAEIPRL